MKRLAWSIYRDFRIQLRTGYPWIAALIAVLGIAACARIPQGNSDARAAFASLAFSLCTTLPFLILQIAGEKREGTWSLLDLSPLRPHEYLVSKAKSLAIPSLAMNTIFVLVSRGPYFNPLPFWIGLSFSGLLFTFIGFLCSAWGGSPARSLGLAGAASAFLLVPVFRFSGFTSTGWAALHPLAGPALLLRGSYAGLPFAIWGAAFGLSLFWTAGLLVLSRKAFKRMRMDASRSR
jgi:fluoroquinolone transport system permease protein